MTAYNHSEPVTIHTVQAEAEAQVIRAFLDGHGITSFLRGESLRLTHGLTMDGLGQVEIQVPGDLADEAHELLEKMQRGDFQLQEDESPET